MQEGHEEAKTGKPTIISNVEGRWVPSGMYQTLLTPTQSPTQRPANDAPNANSNEWAHDGTDATNATNAAAHLPGTHGVPTHRMTTRPGDN